MIKLIDDIVSTLSLHINDPKDRLDYELAYDKLRPTLITGNTVNLTQFEPMRTNRFLICFPDEFNIPAWSVNSIELPQMKRNIFGFKKWSNLQIEVINLVHIEPAHELLQRNKNLNNVVLTFQGLDPTGFIVHQYLITIKKVVNYSFPFYNQYNGDSVATSKIEFSVKDLIINY